jgi:uncharacterized protein
MIKRNKKQVTIYVLIYFLAIVIAGLGVNLILRAELGAGAWDAANANFSELLNITIGTASAITNLLLLSVVIISHKNLKYLVVLVPIFSIAISIDFWDILILGDFVINIFALKILSMFLGVTLISLALAMMIITKYPAMIYDEVTKLLMVLMKTSSFLKARIVLESSAIVLAIIYGFFAGIGLGAVSYGSVVLAFLIGPLIQFHVRVLEKATKNI